MTICCPKSVKACALRITRLNVSDVPLDPLVCASRIQTSGFVELNLNPDVEDGAVLETRNPGGDICIVDRDCDVLKGFEVELKLCGVPITVIEMLVGAMLMADTEGNLVGAGLRNDRSDACSNARMVEVWSKNAAPACDVDGIPKNAWIHWLLPRTVNWQITGSLSFANGPLEVVLRGYAEANPWWYPSLPAPAFPAYVPGGGDEAGYPTGPAGAVIPTGISPDPWTLEDQAVIRGSGPLAWKCVDALPAPIDDCDYLPCEGGCEPETFAEDFCGPEGNIGAPWVDWPFWSGPDPFYVPLVISGGCSAEPDPVSCGD